MSKRVKGLERPRQKAALDQGDAGSTDVYASGYGFAEAAVDLRVKGSKRGYNLGRSRQQAAQMYVQAETDRQ